VFQPSQAEAYSLYPYYIPLQSPSIINDSLHTLYDLSLIHSLLYELYIGFAGRFPLLNSLPSLPLPINKYELGPLLSLAIVTFHWSSKLDLLFARRQTTYNLHYRHARVKSDCECLKYPYPPNQSIYPDRQTIDPSNSTTLLYRLHPCRPSFYPIPYSRYLDRVVVIVSFVSLSQAS
jgi:hypothetical protein